MSDNNDLSFLLKKALTKVTAPYTREAKSLRRRQRMSRSRREYAFARYSSMTIRKAAFRVMEQAYLSASNGGRLPVKARQIMYKARPLILELTDKPWKQSTQNYFTQTLLIAYMDLHPEKTAMWDVVFDARGHIEEPHTGKVVGLGTLNVRSYINDWVTEIPPLTLSNVEMGIKTVGPGNRYKFALFIEKEGFDSLLKAARIQERFDIAVMSTKGMSVTASRSLVEELSESGVTILVAHDCDKTGFSICHTLHNDTRRYTFAREPNVHCLGLRLAEAQQMGLASESVHYSKRVYKGRLKECGATEDECSFIIGDGKDGKRIELDAMDSQTFIGWLERKFAEHGVQKVIPDKATLEAAYKLAILRGQANTAIAQIQQAWNQNGHGHAAPEEIEELVKNTIEGTTFSWDDAINLLAGNKVEEETETAPEEETTEAEAATDAEEHNPLMDIIGEMFFKPGHNSEESEE